MTKRNEDKKHNLSPELEAYLVKQLAEWEVELRKLLPSLGNFTVEFDDDYGISWTGAGGYAKSIDTIQLAFDPNWEKGSKQEQFDNFKGSYFHEAYHLVQGFVGDDEDLKSTITALQNAIWEGAATVFEKTHTKASVDKYWGNNSPEVVGWVEEIASLGTNYDIGKYKFWDDENKRGWVLYRVGVHVVEEVLLANPELSIVDLATFDPDKIYKLYKQIDKTV